MSGPPFNKRYTKAKKVPCRVNVVQSSSRELIPAEELIVLEGALCGKQVTVLKDDGCNTNIISKEFCGVTPCA